MYWILAAIFVLLALAVPRLRPLAVVGLVVLALLFGWALVQRMRSDDASAPLQRSGGPSSPGITSQAIDPGLITSQRLVLHGGGAPFQLRGYLRNGATNMHLRSVTIRLVRHDCHAQTLDPSGCDVLWEDRHWMPMSIPPGEGREFATDVWMRGSAPRPRGELRDSFEVVAATGEPVGVQPAEASSGTTAAPQTPSREEQDGAESPQAQQEQSEAPATR